jgi:hypothetical protein
MTEPMEGATVARVERRTVERDLGVEGLPVPRHDLVQNVHRQARGSAVADLEEQLSRIRVERHDLERAVVLDPLVEREHPLALSPSSRTWP